MNKIVVGEYLLYNAHMNNSKINQIKKEKMKLITGKSKPVPTGVDKKLLPYTRIFSDQEIQNWLEEDKL